MLIRDKITSENLKIILSEFEFCGCFEEYKPYGCGHINDTFLLTLKGTDGSRIDYILQRINGAIFKDVPSLMRNFELVTAFLAKKAEESGGNPKRDVLNLILTKDKKSFVEANGEYFRAFVFIDKATSYQSVEKPEHFFEAGKAFGKFAALLNDFDASLLYESIPDFHNTVKRYQNFENSLKTDTAGRAEHVKAEAAFTTAHKGITDKVYKLLTDKKIPLRVTHNDTKLNNVMIDDATEKAVAVIDLDTVMPGSLLYDFGDSIRSGCNTGAEDEKDLSKVNFDFKLFEAYAAGYLSQVKSIVTDMEGELFAFAPILMTFECGMRFLTDYLDGDVYFKTKYREHNLDRARAQYKLVCDMEKNISRMRSFINNILTK
ncbi:MAG: aminoglycoside phosphotransferase family protein [Clostridiales bacterium]|jgi:hypothetical protein|nr:aminoglycoside phosphotransferase family protein [Clostridiales bacterium]